jgi:transposase
MVVANEEDGIEGLRDRPRPGRQPRVDTVTSARFKERIVAGAALERDGVVAFRGIDAKRILKEEFDIDCGLSSTYRLLHRLKLSWLAPRPRHPEADATAQAQFSQLFNYRRRPLPAVAAGSNAGGRYWRSSSRSRPLPLLGSDHKVGRSTTCRARCHEETAPGVKSDPGRR